MGKKWWPLVLGPLNLSLFQLSLTVLCVASNLWCICKPTNLVFLKATFPGVNGRWINLGFKHTWLRNLTGKLRGWRNQYFIVQATFRKLRNLGIIGSSKTSQSLVFVLGVSPRALLSQPVTKSLYKACQIHPNPWHPDSPTLLQALLDSFEGCLHVSQILGQQIHPKFEATRCQTDFQIYRYTPYSTMKAKERKEHQVPSVRVNWDISRPDSSAQWLHQYHRCRIARNCWSYSGFPSSTRSAPPLEKCGSDHNSNFSWLTGA